MRLRRIYRLFVTNGSAPSSLGVRYLPSRYSSQGKCITMVHQIPGIQDFFALTFGWPPYCTRTGDRHKHWHNRAVTVPRKSSSSCTIHSSVVLSALMVRSRRLRTMKRSRKSRDQASLKAQGMRLSTGDVTFQCVERNCAAHSSKQSQKESLRMKVAGNSSNFNGDLRW